MTSGDSGIGDFLSMERDVLILSLAMFCFSLGFQMTSRYLPRYMSLLGAGAVAVGVFGTLGNLLGAIYPYPGGWFSDRVGSRYSLTIYGLISTIGFGLWLMTPDIGGLDLYLLEIPAWIWILVGLVLSQSWKSLGLGATFALVKQSVEIDRLARGFATTETFRRTAFLLGPVISGGILAVYMDFIEGFSLILGIAFIFGLIATVSQFLFYREIDEAVGKKFRGLSQIIEDIRELPGELRTLLVADSIIRFANGMVYVFFVLVVTELRSVGLDLFGYTLSPDSFFGFLLGIEMVVALLVMLPSAYIADRYGLKPVVLVGFAVYAVFPFLLIYAPGSPFIYAALFAFSGIRFAGLPAHKAFIVGPARENQGGRVTGSYYLVRNSLVIPSALIGGYLYGIDPFIAFSLSSVLGVFGFVYYLFLGERFTV